MWVRIGSKAAVTAVTALAVTGPAWAPAALAWLNSRFAGSQATNDRSQIPPGHSLAPVKPAG